MVSLLVLCVQAITRPVPHMFVWLQMVCLVLDGLSCDRCRSYSLVIDAVATVL